MPFRNYNVLPLLILCIFPKITCSADSGDVFTIGKLPTQYRLPADPDHGKDSFLFRESFFVPPSWLVLELAKELADAPATVFPGGAMPTNGVAGLFAIDIKTKATCFLELSQPKQRAGAQIDVRTGPWEFGSALVVVTEKEAREGGGVPDRSAWRWDLAKQSVVRLGQWRPIHFSLPTALFDSPYRIAFPNSAPADWDRTLRLLGTGGRTLTMTVAPSSLDCPDAVLIWPEQFSSGAPGTLIRTYQFCGGVKLQSLSLSESLQPKWECNEEQFAALGCTKAHSVVFPEGVYKSCNQLPVLVASSNSVDLLVVETSSGKMSKLLQVAGKPFGTKCFATAGAELVAFGDNGTVRVFNSTTESEEGRTDIDRGTSIIGLTERAIITKRGGSIALHGFREPFTTRLFGLEDFSQK